MMNIETDWRPEIGARVLLTDKHPYYGGRTGTVTRREKWMGVPAIAVKLDTGETPGVTRPEQIKVLNNAKNT